ncbi:hypothetical protein N802_10905 [Knoellia sinensis KCTC 19936]|uniref:Type II secretion system protein GspF domain-containing protein n=1 Tax=Knoellia sinensis KCTC 19936 TaxID=1385520 RepID=A0A0A0J7Z8_9MICO|nr:hypothetical protein [Knoellia sinensis]KGN32177.1 hypothetical protein N802_10905 [Knoellia sinensis KCTC 19936]
MTWIKAYAAAGLAHDAGSTVLGTLVMLVVLAGVLWPRARPASAGAATTGRWGSQPGVGPVVCDLVARARSALTRELRFGRRTAGWVSDFAELSAVGLDAGLPAVEAARLACEVDVARARPELLALGDRLVEAQRHGGSVGACLGDAAREDPDLAFLAAAWQLTDEFGVAAAPAARTSADVLRERAASGDRRAVLAAGPRASMWLLTLLPLAGPLVTLVLGLPVRTVYGNPAALIAVVGGLALTALGWWWSRTVLHRALRPSEVG